MRHTPALIETMRIRNGLAPLWYLHIRRLATSCKALGIPLPGELPPPEGGLDRTVRWEVGMRGVQESERLVEPVEPVKLIISRIAHHPYPHKTTDRAQFDRARDKARGAEADDALLLTPGGYLAETAIWSVFWWEGGNTLRPGHGTRDPARGGTVPDHGAGRSNRGEAGHLERGQGRSRFFWRTPSAAWPKSRRSRTIRCRRPSRQTNWLHIFGLDPGVFRAIFPGSGRWPVVVVAQSVRAPDCGSGGCGFDSRQPPSKVRSSSGRAPVSKTGGCRFESCRACGCQSRVTGRESQRIGNRWNRCFRQPFLSRCRDS